LDTIAKIAGDGLTLISSAEETARELKEFLQRKESLREDGSNPEPQFFSSGDESVFRRLGARFLGKEIVSVERVRLPLKERAVGVE